MSITGSAHYDRCCWWCCSSLWQTLLWCGNWQGLLSYIVALHFEWQKLEYIKYIIIYIYEVFWMQFSLIFTWGRVYSFVVKKQWISCINSSVTNAFMSCCRHWTTLWYCDLCLQWKTHIKSSTMVLHKKNTC